MSVSTANYLCKASQGDEEFRGTWAMRASSCSLPSRDSFLLMKSFSVALCCTLNSLHVNSIPLWSSFTSLSTFSRLTGRMENVGNEGRRSRGEKVRKKWRRGVVEVEEGKGGWRSKKEGAEE